MATQLLAAGVGDGAYLISPGHMQTTACDDVHALDGHEPHRTLDLYAAPEAEPLGLLVGHCTCADGPGCQDLTVQPVLDAVYRLERQLGAVQLHSQEVVRQMDRHGTYACHAVEEACDHVLGCMGLHQAVARRPVQREVDALADREGGCVVHDVDDVLSDVLRVEHFMSVDQASVPPLATPFRVEYGRVEDESFRQHSRHNGLVLPSVGIVVIGLSRHTMKANTNGRPRTSDPRPCPRRPSLPQAA